MMPEINIPFPGLYNSWLSGEIEHAEEREIEHYHESQAETWPQALRLDVSEIADQWWRSMNYSIAHEHMARVYLGSFDAWAGDVLGETRPAWRNRYNWETGVTTRERYRADSCGMVWSLMISPREYNFETDRLFVNVSMAFIKRLWKISRTDSHDTLRRVIKERFTSYDGFISHYRADLDAWGALDTWDYNQYGTLLIACLELCDAGYDSLMYDVCEGEVGYNAVSEGMCWETLESHIAEKRSELLEDWAESKPTDCAAWLANNAEIAAPLLESVNLPEDMPQGDACGSFYRCKVTPDLFTGSAQ